ncbi:aldo keto reductase [Raphidocelis subcapitata]|uniref:Aldo keto reductase n=1 Tax=Raphidocelis subcapitata TaxID=307507 RepID=A0A2V0P3W0_9CHLO|nr:aldo keto reductase [Raphidocelis subcapitata]|eukprot:GBF94561.1 aldo keto reductase [Raphidocelis subcapitata]
MRTEARAAGPPVVTPRRLRAPRSVAVAAQRQAGEPGGGEPTPAALQRRALLGAGAAAASGVLSGFGGLAARPPPAAAAPAGAPLPLVPKAPLTPRLSVSQVIKGCWQLSGGHRGERASDRTAGQEAVDDFGAFYRAGITSFDAADHYGPAEALIGRFLGTDPSLRANCQVLSKYCVFSGQEMATVSARSVRTAVETSLKRLGVDSVDLMQFYWGSYSVPRYVDAALHLMDLRAQGLVKEVGVTNFDVPRLEAMAKAGVEIASNQVQYSLLDRRPALGPMADYCASAGTKLLPYGVLAGGFLTDRYVGVDVRNVRADTYSKSKYSSVLVESVGGWEGLQRLLAGLKPIAAKHNTTIANVAARWVLQQPLVPAVILGARNADHVDDHRALFAFALDEGDAAAIGALLEGGRRPKGDCYSWERGGEF